MGLKLGLGIHSSLWALEGEASSHAQSPQYHCHYNVYMYIHVSNKKFLTKTGYFELPQKGQKQVHDIQCNALRSLVHFAVQLHNVD